MLNEPGMTDIAHLRHVPRRHWGRYVSAGLILLFLAFLVDAFARARSNGASSAGS